MTDKSPALFLDRDGVINVDHGYVYLKEDFEFIDGIFDLCRQAKQRAYLIVVITNQAGIGRGFYSEQEYFNLTEWMCGIFKSEGVIIDSVYHCPFHPLYGVGKYRIDAECRKPRPGMLIQATKEHNIDLSRSILIGDKESDIKAGLEAGVGQNIFFRNITSSDFKNELNEYYETIGSLKEAVRYLKN